MRSLLSFATCLRLRLGDATLRDVATASTILNSGWVGGVLVSPVSGKVSKADMGREGKLERIAELGESRLIHKLEECAIRCLTLILI